MDFDTLMKRVASVDKLFEQKLINEDKANELKQRLITAFENSEIPEKRLPKDIGHLPGRMIEGIVDVGRAVARGSGATYKALEEQEQKRGKSKSVVDLYNDLQ